MTQRYSTLAKPQGTWWSGLGRDEKLWVGVAVIWGLAMFVMIAFIWPAIGARQNEIKGYQITPADFTAHTDAFIEAYRVGELAGIPVVAPPPSSTVYLEAMSFSWRPVLQLKRGETYQFLISSRDVQHGFSLLMQPRSLNYQIIPGYVLSVSLTPERSGVYPLACNEFCGLGHHVMLGRIVVTD